MSCNYSLNDKTFRLEELYTSKTFDFENGTAEDLAIAYLDAFNKIDGVFVKNLNAVNSPSLETFLKHED